MNLIFSADRDWGIGKGNELLFRTPGDMAFFRRMTTGNTVILGRKTLESLPGGKPLPKRRSIVLTRDPAFSCPGGEVCRSLPELFDLLSGVPEGEIFVIGGGEVYRKLLPYSRRAYVTRWEARAEADAFVPDLDKAPGWVLEAESEPCTEKGVTYRFCTYRNETPVDRVDWVDQMDQMDRRKEGAR